MKNKKHFLFLLPIALLAFIFLAGSVQAVCPVCTIAVGACLGLSRYIGIDDTISGVWIGGLIVSLIIWTMSWMKSKNIQFLGKRTLTVLFYPAIILIPLYWQGIIGHPFNKLWGADKLIVGIIAGSFFFSFSETVNSALKKKNGGRVFFPFQKVAIPLVILVAVSAIFYFITC
jgi:hypothetical protein